MAPEIPHGFEHFSKFPGYGICGDASQMEFRKDADGLVSCSAFPGEKFDQVVSCTGYSGSKNLFPYCLSAVTPITDLHVHNAWMTGQCDSMGARAVASSWRIFRNSLEWLHVVLVKSPARNSLEPRCERTLVVQHYERPGKGGELECPRQPQTPFPLAWALCQSATVVRSARRRSHHHGQGRDRPGHAKGLRAASRSPQSLGPCQGCNVDDRDRP